MSVALALAVLAFVDCVLCGFRMAAGRNGRLDKRAYYIQAVGRAALWGVVVVAANVGLTAALCASAPDPARTWSAFAAAGELLVVVYGTFATAIFLAFGFYFAPIGDFRVLTNVIVFGPLTLARRVVIVGGMIVAAWRANDGRVLVVAATATIAMIAFEPVLGRRYKEQWRRLVPGDGSSS